MNNVIVDIENDVDGAFEEINRLADRGELMKARRRCEQLLNRFPEHPRVLHGLGLMLYRTGDLEEGESLIRDSINKNPDFSDAYQNLGRILMYSLRIEEAETAYRKALELAPDDLTVMEALSLVLARLEKYDEALSICDRMLSCNPSCAAAYGNYGFVLMSLGKTREGVSLIKKSLALKENCSTSSALLFFQNLLPEYDQKSIFDASLKWGNTFAKRLFSKSRRHFNWPDPNRKLRIGYVSGDFRKHPVGYHLRPVLAAHDKSRFEIFLYNAFPNCDAITEEFSNYVDCYRDVSLKPDEKVESIIRKDGIDILVDLAGHTAFNRLLLFARKPAPVQLTWIGYFNTTGVKAIDYFIGDPITTPAEDDSNFVERILRLPDIRFCYEPLQYAPEVAPVPGVKNKCITFGSFNAIHKMLPEVISLWCRILHAVPDSRMILKSRSFKEEKVKKDFEERFAALGISSDRLDLRQNSSHREMLAEYGDMDISLDTFPYNGGATTCEALWMGVPVVTMAGNTPIGRQTKAYLQVIGCPEWTAVDEDHYLAVAVKLAADLTLLSEIRATLRSKMSSSPLCDGKRFTRNLETAYRQVWKSWCSNTPPYTGFDRFSTKRFELSELTDIGYNFLKDFQPYHAEKIFRRVLKRDATHLPAINGLGLASEAVGNFSRALRCFRRAIKLQPDDSKTHFNIGCFFLDRHKYKQSLKHLLNVTEREEENFEAHLNLGNCFKHLLRSEESRKAFDMALQIRPQSLLARRQLALLIATTGDLDAAIEHLQKNLEQQPDDIESLYALVYLLTYDDSTEQAALLNLGVRISKLLRREISVIDEVCLKAAGGREHLKIGLISADFCYHPVGMLLRAFLDNYDRKKISIYCYHNGFLVDALTKWCRSAATVWREIQFLSDDDTADLVRRDSIDILIDLNGYSDKHRLPVFVRRPAPVQATWLGYWHTTGLAEMDYIIADTHFIRPEDEQWFSEKTVRLPFNRFCFIPPEPCPEVVDSPFLEKGFITFGCFNNPLKINDKVIALWAKIMKTIPDSRIVLKYKTFGDRDVQKRFIDKFTALGVAAKRIEFRNSSSQYLMMVEYGDIDICLDPFPFCGGMTSLLALWMGVPVVTLPGEMPVSRQTSSFLELIGLSGFIAGDGDTYTHIATTLAKNKEQLVGLRSTMRERMLLSPLCDVKGYAADVEQIMFKMWDEALQR